MEHITVYHPDGRIEEQVVDMADPAYWREHGMTEEQVVRQVAMILEGRQNKEEVMNASVGDAVIAPRGGEEGFVALIAKDGGRLVTHDGGYPSTFEGWCQCKGQPDGRYFEFVGGESNGSHGWWDARCGRVFQWG
jgi:hypothetical protein